MAQPPNVLITTSEAARRLGVSRERVRQLFENGMLAGFRIEGRARARYVDLDGEGERKGPSVGLDSGSRTTLRDEHVDNQKLD